MKRILSLFSAVFVCALLSCNTPQVPVDEDVIEIEEIEDEEEQQGEVVCIIKGNDVYVRARQFSPDEDMVWKLTKVKGFHNRYFNISGMYTCPKETSDEDVHSSLTLWKDSSDDICPINVMGTYMGGNHGYDCVDKLKSAGHGKTESDIGSVWADSNGRTYVLTHIYDPDNLGFVKFDESSMETGKMTFGNPAAGTEMIHISGALNQSPVAIESRTGTQLWQCFNKYSMSASLDGRHLEYSADGIYVGSQLEIETRYNIIFIPAMLEYLMSNVGKNDRDSQHSEAIEDHYMTVYVSYIFCRNGSVSTYGSYHMDKNVTMGYVGLVQSMAISSDSYTYVPDTEYDTPSLHGGRELKLTRDTWHSEQKAPYRYYQFADNQAGKGVCLAYDRSIGLGQNDRRLEQLDHAGKYSKAQKMYPCLLSGGTLNKGRYFEAMAARVPLYKYDEDLTSAAWYWIGDDIVLMLDAHKTIDKDIVLPEYMDGMKIEVLDKSSSVEFDRKLVSERKLHLSVSDYGYLVARLYK